MNRLKKVMKEDFKDCVKTFILAYPLMLILYINVINQINWHGLVLWQVVLCYFIAIAIRTIICLSLVFVVTVAADMIFDKETKHE